MSGTSEDVEMLLAGLEVESIAELKQLVDIGRLAENEDFVTATRLRHLTRARPDIGPGWREDSSEECFYSDAWLDDGMPVSSETSRGAAERQPHGCEGQLQQ